MFWTQLNWAAGVIPTLDRKLTSLASKPTVIVSADGKRLFEAQTEYRVPINNLRKEVPEHVIKATLAAEDRRFYSHVGVDWWGVGRALATNVREGRTVQGASTITMQLAKRLYTGTEQTFNRKLKDMALAVQMEKKLPKDEILRIYLNQVFYGSGSYGIRAAAKTYFGKDLKKLSVAEAALLARIVRRPSEENPFVNLEKAVANRNVVLRTMLDEGMIGSAEFNEAIEEKPKLMPKRFASGQHIEASPYFVQYVLDTIKRELPEIDITAGGYRIETTIDAKLDQFAQKQVRSIVSKYRRQKLTTGAFVLMDDKGRILTMVGGYDFDRNEYNVIYQGRRQPGSSFKPFIYASALSTGALGPNDTVSNEQLILREPGKAPRRWPKNGKNRYGGRVSIRTAIASSINVPAVRVCELVTPGVAASYARDVFGFRSPLDPVLALALGSSAVSPLEMAQAYSVFMNYGDRARPFGIVRIIGPDGQVVKDWEPNIQRGVLDKSVCALMDEFLRAVVTSGTGWKARPIEDARGKTGTTSDNRDAWFCGYTNNLVGIGWVGNEQLINGRWEYPPMQSSAFGGTITVEIWTGVMKEAVKKYGKKESNRPENIKPLEDYRDEPPPIDPPVDDVAGGEVPEKTPDLPPNLDPVVPEPGDLFPADRVPPSEGERRPPRRTEGRPPAGNEFIDVEICADSGQAANRYCPETVTRRLSRQDAPRGRCTMHGP
jgi:penicillin-binding protein 1A